MSYCKELLTALDYSAMKELCLQLLGVILCLSIHETSHGFLAWCLGDSTAKQKQRLSLNPLRHIDWFGLLSMVLFGFGWAKPVPVNPSYFRHPKRGMALSALAGPVSNFFFAFLLLLGVRLGLYTAPQWLLLFLYDTALLSWGLGLFNLLPIPPLDGSKILFAVLPDRLYQGFLKYESLGFVLVLLCFFTNLGNSLGIFVYRSFLWVSYFVLA